MPITRAFADAGVLIWAARGIEPLASVALQLLTAADREFVDMETVQRQLLCARTCPDRQVGKF